MGFLSSLKCKMGNHQWGPLRYWTHSKDPQCTQYRDCLSCGKREEFQVGNHEWTDWVVSGGSPCQRERVCSRCGMRDSLPQHDYEKVSTRWDGTNYLDVLKCKHCGRYGERTAVHNHQDDLRDEWGMN